MRPSIVIGVAFLTAAAGPANAQTRAPAPSSSEPSLLSDIGRAELAAEGRAVAGESFLMQALQVGGGALVGAGLGYFASQVVYSDWDKTTNGTFVRERRTFSLSGAAVGAAVMFFAARGTDAVGVGGYGPDALVVESADYITLDQIESSGGITAYDVVQSLRPTWLQTRGTMHIHETGVGVVDEASRSVAVIPGSTTIKVYMDNAQVGGVEALRQVPVTSVRAIRWYDAAEATLRWGSGHTHGAIQVESSTALGPE